MTGLKDYSFLFSVQLGLRQVDKEGDFT